MTYLYLGVGTLLALVLSFAAGRFTAPPSDPVYLPSASSVQVVTVKTFVDRTRVVTRRVVATPDGGSVTDEREEEHVVEHGTPVVLPPQPIPTPAPSRPAYAERRNWKAGVTVGAPLLTSAPVFDIKWGVVVERRILGPVWLGATGNTSGYLGLNLSVEF